MIGCGSDGQVEIQEKEVMEVPVEFNLSSGGNDLITRTDPVGSGNAGFTNERPIYVDRVKVYVYQRSANQSYGTDREGFAKVNELVLTAQETGQAGADGQPRFTASGKVPLESGNEYRMTAMAYSEAQREDSLFTWSDAYYNDAEIALTDKEEYKTPELFFGNVISEAGDTIIQAEAGMDEPQKLSGWLYRGVAGIQLNLTNVDEHVNKIELLADSIYTRVKTRVYDDFHSAYGMQRDGAFSHYVIGSWTKDTGTKGTDNSIQITGPNLLEVCTSLSLRITLSENNDDRQVVCRLRVRDTDSAEGNGGNQLRSIPGDAGNGTGIIPGGEETPVDPEDPDTDDKNPYRICFKRNHYYVLAGDYTKLTTMEYVLQVLVNPNWDGDVYLPLDKDSN